MTGDLQHLPRRDLERLSAYLDGELPPDERAKLEARLEEEPRLRSALAAIRSTVSMLRALPAVRAPRNYSLTPEMAGIRQRPWAYPVLQFATAVAAFAFLIVVGFDALTTQLGVPAEQFPESAAPSMMEESPPEAFRLEEPLPEEAPAEEPPADAASDQVTGEEERAAAGTPVAEMEMQAEAPAEAGGQGLPTPTAVLSQAPSATPLPTEQPSTTPAPTVAPTATAVRTDVTPGMVPTTLLRATEIGLAALVILLALATLRLRPKRP